MGDTITKNVQKALKCAVCKGCKDFKEHIRKYLNCSGQTANRNLGFEDVASKSSKWSNTVLKTGEGNLLVVW